MQSKSQVLNKRRNLFSIAKTRNSFNKGDKRVHTPRICSICGRALAEFSPEKQKYVTAVTHFHCKIESYISLDACKDVQSCYRYLKKKGELEDGNGE